VLDVASALTSQQGMVDWMLKAKRKTGDRDNSGGGSNASMAPSLPPIGSGSQQASSFRRNAASFRAPPPAAGDRSFKGVGSARYGAPAGGASASFKSSR